MAQRSWAAQVDLENLGADLLRSFLLRSLMRTSVNKRTWMYLQIVVLFFGLAAKSLGAQSEGPFFASGIKVGEATSDSVIVWVRLTKEKQARFDALDILTEGLPSKASSSATMPEDVVPGSSGIARVLYAVDGVEQWKQSPWKRAISKNDYTLQFRLTDLEPGREYRFEVQAKNSEDQPQHYAESGTFKTAPSKDADVPIRFIVTTCQSIRSIDSGTDGHRAYEQMLVFQPDFFVHTGDIIYYDKAPFSRTLAQARAKWNLMFAYGNIKRFHRQTSSYFMKDDHDTLKNDCWAGQTYGDLTFEQGLEIFREQTCMGDSTYRTARWGKHVQVWMTENRDFRSSNRIPDGPQKTILGREQKAWLKKSVAESDATFKFLITPGPWIGPDKPGKSDNHANAAFATEGKELREFAAGIENTYVICGDRHWQYCSQDPATGLIEFGCGPINDEHDFGGDPGKDPNYHRYFGSRGGFLGITVLGDSAKAEWFSANEPVDSNGMPKILHTEPLPIR